MSCCGQHRANAVLEADAPDAIQPDDPCLLCAEKHFETAYVLCAEYGYTDTNRGRAIGELVLCGWHLAKLGATDLWQKVRRVSVLVGFRRESEINWRVPALEIDVLAGADADKLLETKPTDKKEA